MNEPARIRGDASQYMLHRFGRRLGWRVSVNGRAVRSYEELNAVLASLRQRMPASEIVVQEDVQGDEIDARDRELLDQASPPDYPIPDVDDVIDAAWDCVTPARLPLENATRTAFERIAAATNAFDRPCVTMALSIKTEPSPRLAKMARAFGWWAEGISADEVRWAGGQGFEASNIILNGPLTHQHATEAPVAIAFADTIDGFREVLRSDRVTTPGIRLRPPSVTSRFGVALNQEALDAIAHAIRDRGRDYAVHFHRAIPVIGPDAWWVAAEEVIDWASRIAQRSGIAPVAIDFGGGWYADDLHDVLLPRLGELHARVAQALPSVERIFFEPGKAIAAPSSCLVATIADVRMSNGHVREIVVDTSIAQLPTTRWMPHRAVVLGSDGSRTWLGSGTSRVLGNVCMEVDVVLENVGFLHVPQRGDRLLIADAGAYDASMAWLFARGRMAE